MTVLARLLKAGVLVNMVFNPERKDPCQHEGSTEAQSQSPGTDSQEQLAVGVPSDSITVRLFARLGGIFRNSGIQVSV